MPSRCHKYQARLSFRLPKVEQSTEMFKSFRAYHLIPGFFLLALFALTPSTAAVYGQRRQAAAEPQSAGKESDPLKVLQWRSIGPFRGGRSTAVAGVASQPMVFYFGGTGGGVWKTSDGGDQLGTRDRRFGFRHRLSRRDRFV